MILSERAHSVLYIAPESFLSGGSGSSQRMRQTLELLQANFETVDIVTIGPAKNCDINVSFDKKGIARAVLRVPEVYDVVFCNYIFVLELLKFHHHQKIICDIHDDLIDRDSRLGADWFTRTQAEVKSTIDRTKPCLVHISAVEVNIYENLFPEAPHFFLPFEPPKTFKDEFLQNAHSFNNHKNHTSASRCDFGFIGTQNNVNAKALKNLIEIVDGLPVSKKVAVCGPLSEGVTGAPHYVSLMGVRPLFDHYNSFETLLCPVLHQTGASTKVVEAMILGKPMIPSSHLMPALGIIPEAELPSNVPEFIDFVKSEPDLGRLLESLKLRYGDVMKYNQIQFSKYLTTL